MKIPTGLRCPNPNCCSRWVPEVKDPKVRRTKKGYNKITRYRQCQHCGRRFTTTERVDTIDPCEEN